MTEAIERVLSSPPEWSAVGTTSPLDGLRRRRLSGLDVMATAVGATKPAATSFVAPMVVVSYVGPGAWLSIVIAVAVALLLRSVIGEFTSRVVTTGSLYTFVVRALGAWAGLVTAVAMLMAYALAGAYAVTSAGLSAQALVTRAGPTPSLHGPGSVAAIGLVGLLCGLVLLRRVSTFTALTLVFEAVAVVVAGILVAIVLQRGSDLGGALALGGAEPRRIVGGATIMLAMLVGFEVPASHGAEAARPFKSVPLAMRASLLAAGVLTLVTTVAVAADDTVWLAGFPQSVRIENLWFPGQGFQVIGPFRVVRILCNIACALAFWSAAARLVFVLALEGALPRWLARTDPVCSAPRRAVICLGPLVVGPGVVLVLTGAGVRDVLASLLDGAGLLMVVAYAATCVAVPVFLTRIGEVSLRPVLAAAAAGAAMVATMASNLTWMDHRGSLTLVTIVAGAVLPTATIWHRFLRLRRREVLDLMGMHDQTIASDMLREGRPRSVRQHSRQP